MCGAGCARSWAGWQSLGSPAEVWGFLCDGGDTETPLDSTHVLGVTGWADTEGMGWLQRARKPWGCLPPS